MKLLTNSLVALVFLFAVGTSASADEQKSIFYNLTADDTAVIGC